MDAKLRPRYHFAKLLQRIESAWQCDKGIRRVGHKRLALVNGVDADDPPVSVSIAGDTVRLADE